jgi:threonine synthase
MGIIERYRKFLPITDATPLITLGEGNTPLIRADKLAKALGFLGELYLKFEGANPTGSFKDRGMVVAVAKALEEGMEMFVCASTGNTAASASAYGAEVGVPVAVFVPKGGIARGKLMQINAYGAKLVLINGNFDACQNIVKELVRKYPKIGLLNSINPYRLEGQKTAAFEIWESLGRAPDYHFIPVGNGGNITAYWMGYKEYMAYDRGSSIPILPKMMGYQAEGAAPIVRGHIIENPQTIASAIKIGNPARWKEAVATVSESGGRFDTVSDEEILYYHNLIPRLHPNAGCEPASAASVAGLQKALRNGEIKNSEGTLVVCVLTGALWKDPETVLSRAKRRQKSLDPELVLVERFLKL